MLLRTYLSLIAGFSSLTEAIYGVKPSSLVKTRSGPLQGSVVPANTSLQQPRHQDVTEFLGIPFAAPPVGDLRFRKPRPYNVSWTKPRQAFKRGQKCDEFEDCLYLDIYTPANAPGSRSLPVLFWIHGGGFRSYDFSQSNGRALSSEHDLVVVRAHYRLGNFGFFASKSSLAEEGSTGNWGMLDQRAALEYVKDNIASFGGNPKNVTIAGESAGAFSVLWHLSSKGSAGLFSKAIMQSTVAQEPIFFQNKKDAYPYYDWVATQLGKCNSSEDLACLRAAKASDFVLSEEWSKDAKLKNESGPPWASPLFPVYPVGPVLDEVELLKSPLAIVESGEHSKVPTILGVNENEGTAFMYYLGDYIQGTPKDLNDDFFDKAIMYLAGTDAIKDDVLKRYPKGPYEKKFPRMPNFSRGGRLFRDPSFHCQNLRLANALRKWDDRVYLYSFKVDNILGIFGDFPLLPFPKGTFGQMGFFHSAELPFVMKHFPEQSEPSRYLFVGHPPRQKNDSFHQLSDYVSCMWANMVYSGDPVSRKAPCAQWVQLVGWPKFDGEHFLRIDIKPRVMSLNESHGTFPNDIFPTEATCEAWARHRPGFRDVRFAVNGLKDWHP